MTVYVSKPMSCLIICCVKAAQKCCPRQIETTPHACRAREQASAHALQPAAAEQAISQATRAAHLSTEHAAGRTGAHPGT